MIYRFEISSKVTDTRAKVKQQHLYNIGFTGLISNLWLSDIYTIEKDMPQEAVDKVSTMLANPVTQIVSVISANEVQPKTKLYNISIALSGRGQALKSEDTNGYRKKKFKLEKFDYAIEIGFLPGVTDNVASTTKESIGDLLKVSFRANEDVYTSQLLFLTGKLSKVQAREVGQSFANPLINRISVWTYDEFLQQYAKISVPKVSIKSKPSATIVNLDVSDEELKTIGKKGIANKDGSRRGPLALDLLYMKAIQTYYKKLKRNPTDIELESLAQTWSEHCKHTIFADPIDDIQDGLYKTYIKRATQQIRKTKGKKDFCASVFTDNSGAIDFDDNYLITHKVETHNSPSALDPFGGSITGIVGVNRDAIGFGLGAKPVANTYGFCFADPEDEWPIYKGENNTQQMLSPRRILEGVVQGVNSGGNCSGIPTPQGFVYFDKSYKGKPLVFVGTVGLIPKKVGSADATQKKAEPQDYIVMIGGRVGKDGIHGATFSSEAIDAGSPVSAVQIGDPITQKKLSDAIVKEARDLGLYTSITDNGAGGLSCSVAEMAKESGGCVVELDKVPLKYTGLEPWEIWISESQERMTLAVSIDKWKQFAELMQRRGVEATVIGTFTDSGKCVVQFNNETVMDIAMDFLHDGLPTKRMITQPIDKTIAEFILSLPKNHTNLFHTMLSRLNISSTAFISSQYDHEVQGSSVLKPLQGRGRVQADASVIRPVLNSPKGVVLSQGLYPTYSEIDAYHMAACSIDTAIRNAVAIGADIEKLALLDNFCWCSSNDPKRLWQLKHAAKACYDTAVAYGTPFISGKDSMFNDFKGFEKNGSPVEISILPTLLISSIGIIPEVSKTVSLDFKNPGDLIYVLGNTYEEMGGTEYLELLKEKKDISMCNSPRVDAMTNKKLYKALYKAIQEDIVASSQSIARGGLAIAFAKSAVGGMLGVNIDLQKLPGIFSRNDTALFSESQGRILVSISPENKKDFERLLIKCAYALIGQVRNDSLIRIKGIGEKVIIKSDVNVAKKAYEEIFRNY